MANGKSSKHRRREVRKAIAKPTHAERWRDVVRSRQVLWAAGYATAFAVVAAALAVFGRADREPQVGDVLTEPYVARVGFGVVNAEATEKNREQARGQIGNVYVPNDEYFLTIRNNIDAVLSLESLDQVYASQLEEWHLEDAWPAIQRYQAAENQANARSRVDRFMQGLQRLPVIKPERLAVEERTPQNFITIMTSAETGEPVIERWQLIWLRNYLPGSAKVREDVEAMAREHFEIALAPTIAAIANSVDPRPTFLFNKEITARIKDEKAEAVTAEYDTYAADEVMKVGEDRLVPGLRLKSNHLAAIRAERAAWEAASRGVRTTDWVRPLALLAVMLLISGGLWVYLFAYNPRVVRNPVRGFALTALLAGCLGASVLLTVLWGDLAYFMATAPVLLAAMVLCIVYDQRFALAIGMLLAVTVLISLDQSVGFVVPALTGVAVSVAMLKDVRSRSKVVTVGAVAGLAMAAAVGCAGLAERPLSLTGAWTQLGQDVVFALLSGCATGLLVQGILPLIEKAFHVTTAMTLKELNDASHPLLKRLAEDAPGTYQHSLRIADMAETAAEAIGADGLLARVGAMYHDIGKMNKPQYFIENQGSGPNRHEKLSPAMSLLIIVGHVKDGIEMARDHGLPKSIQHIIESHHGTTLVEFFYHAAKKKKEAEDKKAPSEFEYRYPGPKPRTKEAGILLLADSVEAAARALDEPTPVRLEQLVHVMANKRLMDGQFDACNLTLHELGQIEAAVTKTLCAIHHSRIKYPSDKPLPVDAAREREQAAEQTPEKPAVAARSA